MSTRTETVTYYKCDRCGKEVDFDPFDRTDVYWSKIDIVNNIHAFIERFSYEDYDYDLCGNCREAFIKFMRNE